MHFNQLRFMKPSRVTEFEFEFWLLHVKIVYIISESCLFVRIEQQVLGLVQGKRCMAHCLSRHIASLCCLQHNFNTDPMLILRWYLEVAFGPGVTSER